MNANFRIAINAFVVACIVTWLVSAGDKTRTNKPLMPLVFEWRAAWNSENAPLLIVLSALLLICCIALNIVWR